MDSKKIKIDLTMMRDLVSRLETVVAKAESADLSTINRDDNSTQNLVAELASAYGLASALSLEAGALAMDAVQALKLHGLGVVTPQVGKAKMSDLNKTIEELFNPPGSDKPKPGGSIN